MTPVGCHKQNQAWHNTTILDGNWRSAPSGARDRRRRSRTARRQGDPARPRCGRFVVDAEAVWPERLSRSIERPVMGETLMRAVVVLGSRRPRADSRLAWRT
jgi:hypothetical protein